MMTRGKILDHSHLQSPVPVPTGGAVLQGEAVRRSSGETVIRCLGGLKTRIVHRLICLGSGVRKGISLTVPSIPLSS
jgi:hypothetical protein